MTDMQKKSFGTMLSPIRAGQHMLRNRVIMGSMHTRLETEPDSIARQIAFYAERARRGGDSGYGRICTQCRGHVRSRRATY